MREIVSLSSSFACKTRAFSDFMLTTLLCSGSLANWSMRKDCLIDRTNWRKTNISQRVTKLVLLSGKRFNSQEIERAKTDLHVSRQTISGEHGLDGDGQYVE